MMRLEKSGLRPAGCKPFANMPYATSRFVWYDSRGYGRNRFACFRRGFELREVPRRASLNLFADTAYQLFVNGSFVQMGPVRFDRLNPQYDTVDISQWLVEGRNVVAALVKSFGCKTFKDNSTGGAFLAWGGMEDGAGGAVDFRTGSDTDWKAKRCLAFDEHAVKLSFALDAIDVFDQSKLEEGWQEVEFDDAHWPGVVELEDQRSGTKFSPRSIPFMELEPMRFSVSQPTLPLANRESVLSFSVPVADIHDAEDLYAKRGALALGVATFLHSPNRQEVTLGVSWGRYFVNGKDCSEGAKTDCLRKDIVVELKPGWNRFFAFEHAHDDCMAFMLAMPRSAALSVSARRRMGDDIMFARTYVLDPRLLEDRLDRGVPEAFDSSFDDQGGWLAVDSSQSESNPGRRSLWDEYDSESESVTAQELQAGKRFSVERYPHGFSVLVEFEATALVLPSLEIEGAAGSVVDLSYSESFDSDGQHLRQKELYCAGDRLLPSGKRLRYLASQPRGARYVRLTVRNASGDVVVRNLTFRSCRYPVKRVGRFRCSDTLLNEIWELCERTQRASMEDAYVDCPGRERGMYVRDTIIQFHNALAAYGDTALMGRCLELIGQSPEESGKFRCVYPNTGCYTIADFSMEAIEGYWQYYLRSGDLERLEKDWQAMRGSIGWFNKLSDERKDGLLDADWPSNRGLREAYGGLHSDNCVAEHLLDKRGPNANLTFPYLAMLRNAVLIAQAIGKKRDAAELEARRRRVAATARSAFWNDEKWRFNDNLAGETQSVHANLLAITSGVAEVAQRRSVRGWLERDFREIFVNGRSPCDGVHFSPAYSFFIFRGLYELDLPHVAEMLIRKGWGWMLARGCVTTPEFFSLGHSQCHAWSASPMYYLSRYGLGIRFPEAPNLRVVELDIRSELDWAEGSFPLPGTDEAIDVQWSKTSRGKIEACVRAPQDVVVRWDARRIDGQRVDGCESDSLSS